MLLNIIFYKGILDKVVVMKEVPTRTKKHFYIICEVIFILKQMKTYPNNLRCYYTYPRVSDLIYINNKHH